MLVCQYYDDDDLNDIFCIRCETAALFVQCSSEEAIKNDLDPMTMAKAIHSAYYRLKPIDTRPSPPLKEQKGYFIFNWPSVEWWPH